jgi:hypothetical protein
MIDQPSLAILIDCWESTRNGPMFKRIISFLENNENIKTVVLASYNSKNSKNKHWNDRYIEIFNKSTSRKIQDLAHIHSLYNKDFNDFPEENTHPIILNYVSNKKDQVLMQWPWELEYYLSINPEIKNIYVLGQAWEVCLKIRPLGYESLKEIKDINILTNLDCVASFDFNFTNLDSDPNWYYIVDNIWKYNYG